MYKYMIYFSFFNFIYLLRFIEGMSWAWRDNEKIWEVRGEPEIPSNAREEKILQVQLAEISENIE